MPTIVSNPDGSYTITVPAPVPAPVVGDPVATVETTTESGKTETFTPEAELPAA